MSGKVLHRHPCFLATAPAADAVGPRALAALVTAHQGQGVRSGLETSACPAPAGLRVRRGYFCCQPALLPLGTHALLLSAADIWHQKFREHCPVCLNTNSWPPAPGRPGAPRTQLHGRAMPARPGPHGSGLGQSTRRPWHAPAAHLGEQEPEGPEEEGGERAPELSSAADLPSTPHVLRPETGKSVFPPGSSPPRPRWSQSSCF